jgi:hypothetical protein
MRELHGIDADAAGNVYVVDTYPNSILYKFAPNGALLNSTPLDAGFYGDDIAIDEIGQRLFMSDELAAGQGIRVFDISGAAPAYIGNFLTPANSIIFGIDYAGESGHILATDFGLISSDPRGLEYSPTGTLLYEYRATPAAFAWDITTLPVPEPASIVLLLVGFAIATFFSCRPWSVQRQIRLGMAEPQIL